MERFHKLNLFDNAIDSLNEALVKYASGKNGKIRDLKFAVLHISHFSELIFKNYLYEIHPLLIYKQPFSKNINEEQTVSLWDAINFIENSEGDGVLNDLYFNLRDDLEWMKKLRNTIEHYAFNMDVDKTKLTIGRIITAVCNFHRDYSKESIAEKICPENRDLFRELIDDFEEIKKLALKQVSESETKYWCSCCCLESLIPVSKNSKELKCYICDSESSLVNCSECTNVLPLEEMKLIDDEFVDKKYLCDSCNSYYTRHS